MPEYNFTFDWNRVTTIGKVKVLAEQVSTPPTQEQIDEAVAAYIAEHPGSISGLSEAAKVALLQLAEKVVYIDEHGQDYYDALYAAFYPPVELDTITAVYTQTGTVYDSDTLDSLKADLVVTANYTDGTSEVVPDTDYTLSGTLTVGTCTITATYEGKTDSFTVTVTSALLYNWDFTDSLTDTVGGVTATLSGATQDANGIHITGATNSALLGDVLAFARTVEIDYTDASIAFGSSVNGVWFWTDANQSTHSGFGYHYSSTPANNKYGFYSNDTAHWAYAESYGKTSFNGNGTIKFTVSAEGTITVYKDGTDIQMKYNGAAPFFTQEANCKQLLLGSAYSSYPAFYNVYITAVRIYEGVR